MRKLFECKIDKELYGVVSINDIPQYVTIFADKIANIVGYKQYVPVFYIKDHAYYEIGYFIDMISRGDKFAFEILNTNKESIIHEDVLFGHLSSLKEELVHRALLTNLVASAEKAHKNMKKSSSLGIVDRDNVKLVDYNRFLAYECHLDIRLAKDLIENKKFMVERKDFITLQAILEGKFLYRTLEKSFREILGEVKTLSKKTSLRESLSINKLNNILLTIRDERRTFF